MNYIEQYQEKLETGEIVAGKKLKKVYAHIAANLHADAGAYYFDEREAKKAIGFIEGFCCIPKFKDGRQPFLLELWQKALVSCLFGFRSRETGRRQYREIFLFVGRKNA